MSGEKLSEILSGKRNPVTRSDLHAALDDLLDEAALDDAGAGSGQHYPVLFWEFMAMLARGRGVADELENTAAKGVISGIAEAKRAKARRAKAKAKRAKARRAKTGKGKAEKAADEGPPDGPVELWRAVQWATLFHLLKRLSLFGNDILPNSFAPVAFTAPAVNILRGGGYYPDTLGLGTSRGDRRSMERTAQFLLVSAVHYRMGRDDLKEAEARRRVLPPKGHPGIRGSGFERTWADWKHRTTEMRGTDAPADQDLPAHVFELDESQIKELWRIAYIPNHHD